MTTGIFRPTSTNGLAFRAFQQARRREAKQASKLDAFAEALAESGSVAEASAAVGISKPSGDTYLSRIRKSLGVAGAMIASIKSAVGRRYGLDAELLAGPCQKRPFAHPRQVAMVLSRSLTGKSRRAIGRHFGGRDHSTVYHAERAVQNRRETDPALDRDLRLLTLDLLAPLAEEPDGYTLIAGALIRIDALPLVLFRRGA